MAKKRRPDGLIEVKVTIGKDVTGKVIRKSFYGQTKKEAQQKAEEYKLAAATHSLVDSKMTLAEWANKWLAVYKEDSVKGNTFSQYRIFIESHIIPYFGNAPIAAIRPIDVKNFYNSKTKYSASFQRKLAMICFAIFEAAIDNDLIYKNPAKNIKPDIPAAGREPKRAYSQEQAAMVRKYARMHRFGAEILCLLDGGLRRGEMLALSWSDVDIDNAVLHITKAVALVGNQREVSAPKTDRSKRSIPIPDSLLAALSQLPKSDYYLFPTQQGEVQRPDTWMKRHYQIFMDEMAAYYESQGVQPPPALNPHELRHTCASLMLEDGVDLVTISRYLGHSDTSITDRVYVHISVEQIRSSINKAREKVVKMS